MEQTSPKLSGIKQPRFYYTRNFLAQKFGHGTAGISNLSWVSQMVGGGWDWSHMSETSVLFAGVCDDQALFPYIWRLGLAGRLSLPLSYTNMASLRFLTPSLFSEWGESFPSSWGPSEGVSQEEGRGSYQSLHAIVKNHFCHSLLTKSNLRVHQHLREGDTDSHISMGGVQKYLCPSLICHKGDTFMSQIIVWMWAK